MKEWWSLRELADAKLPGLPGSERSLQRVADREGWASRRVNGMPLCRPRRGRGGGTEFHASLFPDETRAHLARRRAPKHPAVDLSQIRAAGAGELRDARLAILAAAEKVRLGCHSAVEADKAFTVAYNTRQAALDAWVYECVGRVSPRTLRRWREAAAAGEPRRLPARSAARRRATALLSIANDGAVSTFIAALLVRQPHLTADHVRSLVRAEFGDTLSVSRAKGGAETAALPSVRTFQSHIQAWKNAHKHALTAITNPDRFKGALRVAGFSRDRITRLNELWEIDASPADVLTRDGRHSLYVLIDIWSRRIMALISKTARAESALLLIRRAILAWGVPECIRTDNGSDFVAHRVKRSFAALGIEHDLCDPFSPEQKGIVERAIGTMQRDLMPLLPGFIGHNVTDRQQIRARATFAARLGEDADKTFCVELSASELQDHVDQWAASRYGRRVHSALGRSPFEQAASYAGRVRRIENERALDLLLADVAGSGGVRTVGRQGLRIDGNLYLAAGLMPGERVLVRHDPTDMGRVYCFTPDGEAYLGEALCPEIAGVDRAKAVAAARAEQKRIITEETAAIRKEARRIKPRDMANAILGQAERDAAAVIAFPKPSQPHQTPQIAAASEVLRLEKPMRPTKLSSADASRHQRLIAELSAAGSGEAGTSAKVSRLPETEKQRFKRALGLERAIAAGEPVDTKQALWLGRYQSTAEYRSHLSMLQDFGEDWLSGPHAASG